MRLCHCSLHFGCERHHVQRQHQRCPGGEHAGRRPYYAGAHPGRLHRHLPAVSQLVGEYTPGPFPCCCAEALTLLNLVHISDTSCLPTGRCVHPFPLMSTSYSPSLASSLPFPWGVEALSPRCCPWCTDIYQPSCNGRCIHSCPLSLLRSWSTHAAILSAHVRSRR